MAKRRQRRLRRLAWSMAALTAATRRAITKFQRSRQVPTIHVDGPAPHARRLKRLVRNVTCAFTSSLGAAPPATLAIIVQHVVHEGRQLNASLKTFDHAEGSKRYLLQLALSVDGRQVTDEELLVALRAGLVRVLADSIGEPTKTVAIELDLPESKQVAPMLESKTNGHRTAPWTDHDAIRFQRIGENDHA